MIIIYISGIDGCGKTTQSRLLEQWINHSGHSVEYQWLRWEPSIIPLLKRARKLLSGGRGNTGPGSGHTGSEDRDEARWGSFKKRLLASPLFRKLWLAYASRDYYRAYRNRSREWNSEFVVLDRYLYDFIVDQAVNLQCGTGELEAMLQGSRIGRMRRPDYFVFIDIPAKTGYERKMDGTPLSYLEKRGHLYAELANGSNTLHIDGLQTPEQIHARIKNWISEKTGLTMETET